jgi:cytochrome b561
MKILERYPFSMRFMHHLISILIITLLAVGIYMTDLDKKDPLRMTLYTWHKTFGWFVLWLVIIRVILRLVHKPKFEGLPKVWEVGAKIGHYALYAFMFIMPLSGWLMSSAAGYNIKLFGIEALIIPNLIAKNQEMAGFFKEIHQISAYILIVAIIGHVLAALKHKYCHKVNVISRMIP